jgi:hypothetical protein
VTKLSAAKPAGKAPGRPAIFCGADWYGVAEGPGGDTSSVDSRALKKPQSRNPRDQ